MAPRCPWAVWTSSKRFKSSTLAMVQPRHPVQCFLFCSPQEEPVSLLVASHLVHSRAKRAKLVLLEADVREDLGLVVDHADGTVHSRHHDIGASPAQGSRVHANQPSAFLACPLRRYGSPSESCRRDGSGGHGVFPIGTQTSRINTQIQRRKLMKTERRIGIGTRVSADECEGKRQICRRRTNLLHGTACCSTDSLFSNWKQHSVSPDGLLPRSH